MPSAPKPFELHPHPDVRGLLNDAGIKPDLLPYVCDAAPAKQGKYLPGSHIPIRPPATLRDEPPDDGRIRHWIWVDALQRYLRVVTLADGQTIHNAFPDRRFRP